MKYTHFGHSCFQIEINGSTLLFDPFLRPNEQTKHIDPLSLKPDFILVSHGHFDHVADLIEIAKNSGATVVAGYEIAEWAQKQGVEKAIGMNIGGTVKLPFGKVKLTAAVHSSVLPDGSYAGNPYGFLILSDEANIYYSGDTALTMDMQLIPLWAPQLDVAILPIGDHFTMGVEDAVIAAQWVKAKKVFPVHYNTFPPIAVDIEAAKAKFASAGIELILP